MAYNQTRLKVSDEHMDSNYDSLSDLKKKITTNSNEIMQIVDSIGSYYQGPAYEAFRNTMINGLASIEGLSTYMDNFLDAYAEANTVYKNTERKVYNYVHDL